MRTHPCRGSGQFLGLAHEGVRFLGRVMIADPSLRAFLGAINGRRIEQFSSRPLLGSKGSRDHLSPISIVLDDVFLFVCLEGPQFLGRCANVKLALVNYKVIRIDVREPALR